MTTGFGPSTAETRVLSWRSEEPGCVIGPNDLAAGSAGRVVGRLARTANACSSVKTGVAGLVAGPSNSVRICRADTQRSDDARRTGVAGRILPASASCFNCAEDSGFDSRWPILTIQCCGSPDTAVLPRVDCDDVPYCISQ